MANIVERNLRTLNNGLKKVQAAGLLPTRVVIRTEVWDSGIVGKGNVAIADREITNPRPEVEDLEGGTLGYSGRYKLSGIVPKHPGGGWLVEELKPPQPPGTITYYVLDGPHTFHREVEVVGIDVQDAFDIIVYAADRK